MAIICRALLLALLPVLAGAQTFPEYEWWWWGGAPAPAWAARFASPGCIPTGTTLSPGPTVLTVARADPQWVETSPGVLTQCAANTLAVSSTGGEVWGARTNAALQSSTPCVGNAALAPWAMFSATCAGDAAVAPDGTTSMDAVTTTIQAGDIEQATTTASSTTFVGSVWAQPVTGTQPIGVEVRAGTASACACVTSDGRACTAAIGSFGAGRCGAVVSMGVTDPAVRLSVMSTSTVATTTPMLALYPTGNSTTLGTTRFWGAQLEAAAYPGPYIPTTTVAVSRAGTTASVPAPDISNDVWCEAQTYKPGQAWNTAGTRYIGSNFAGVAANSIDLAKDATNIILTVTDHLGALKTVTYAHGETTATTARRIVGCNSAGTLSLYVDGVSVGVVGGVGLGTQTATLTPWQIGARNGAGQIDGSVTGQKFCPNASYSGCQ